jgi:hypothetical protein
MWQTSFLCHDLRLRQVQVQQKPKGATFGTLTGTEINKRLEPSDEEGNMKRRAEDTMQSQRRESVKRRTKKGDMH